MPLSPEKASIVTKIATDIRNEYIDVAEDELLTGWCLDVSKAIKAKLDEVGIESDIVQGGFLVDLPLMTDEWEEIYDPLHYWIEIDDTIVDATCTQFQEYMESDLYIEEVYIDTIEKSVLHHTIRGVNSEEF